MTGSPVMEPLSEDQTPSAELRRFLAVARVAFKGSMALAGLNAVFGLLVVAGTWVSGCAVHVASEDDGSGSGVGLVFIPALLAAMVGLMTSPRHERTFEEHNVAPYEFLPMLRLTLAEVVFYSTLAVALAMFGLVLAVSVEYSLSLLTACSGGRLFG